MLNELKFTDEIRPCLTAAACRRCFQAFGWQRSI